MIILAGDTSGATTSVAIYKDGKIIASCNLALGLTHSETFMPLVENVLKMTNLTFQDIDALACAIGPGSFTGVRIGVSAFKMLAYSLNIPVYGISSLKALAYQQINFTRKFLIIPTIDARNHRVFGSAYMVHHQDYQPLIEAKATDFTEFILEVKKRINVLKDCCDILCVGKPFSMDNVAAETKTLLNDYNLHFLDNEMISAEAIIMLALESINKGLKPEASELLPSYLVPSQAERMRLESKGNLSTDTQLRG